MSFTNTSTCQLFYVRNILPFFHQCKQYIQLSNRKQIKDKEHKTKLKYIYTNTMLCIVNSAINTVTKPCDQFGLVQCKYFVELSKSMEQKCINFICHFYKDRNWWWHQMPFRFFCLSIKCYCLFSLTAQFHFARLKYGYSVHGTTWYLNKESLPVSL